MLRYYIVGTKHPLQEKTPFRNNPDTSLREKLAEIICNRPVVLIAEEVDPEADIYGRELAASQNPQIPWLSIDMPEVQQINAGIADDLNEAARRNEEAHSRGEKIVYHPQRASDVREACWLEKIRIACEIYKITEGTVLITCGRVHLESLADKAMKLGIQTDTLEWPSGLLKEIGKIERVP
jgi:hypothetical protein